MDMHADVDPAQIPHAQRPRPIPQPNTALDAPSPTSNKTSDRNDPRRWMLEKYPLSVRQLLAMNYMLVGMSVSQTAEAVGVGRSTVQRWLSEDEDFRAVWNSRMFELWKASDDRLHSCAMSALEVIHAQLRTGDLELALRILDWVQTRPADSAVAECPEGHG